MLSAVPGKAEPQRLWHYWVNHGGIMGQRRVRKHYLQTGGYCGESGRPCMENRAPASWTNSSQRHRQLLPPGSWWVSTSCTPFLSNNRLKMLQSEALLSFE